MRTLWLAVRSERKKKPAIIVTKSIEVYFCCEHFNFLQKPQANKTVEPFQSTLSQKAQSLLASLHFIIVSKIRWGGEARMNKKPSCLMCYRNHFCLALKRQLQTPARFQCWLTEESMFAQFSLQTPPAFWPLIWNPPAFLWRVLLSSGNKHWTSWWLFSADFPVVPSQLWGIPNGKEGFRTSLHIEICSNWGNIHWTHENLAESPLFMVKDRPGQRMSSKSSALCVGQKSRTHRRCSERKDIMAMSKCTKSRRLSGVQMIWERPARPEKPL